MPLSPIKPPDEAPVAPARNLRLPLDPLLTLAVIGLGVCSVLTLKVATRNLTGDAHYYVERQGIYLATGFVFMLALSRLDYALLRHYKTAIYVTLLLSILAVLGLGHSANGAQRAINLPLFSFQASELGKILLILALAGVPSRALAPPTRARHHMPRDGRRAGAHDVRDRPARPRLGPGVHGDRLHAAVRRRHLLAAPGGAGRSGVSIAFVLVAAPGRRRARAPALPGGTTDGVPASLVEHLKEGETSTDPTSSTSRRSRSAPEKAGRGAERKPEPDGFVPESDTDFVFAAVGEQLRLRRRGPRAAAVRAC